jgi:hypothetical protein
MELSPEQFKIIEPMLPKQAGNVKTSDFETMSTTLLLFGKWPKMDYYLFESKPAHQKRNSVKDY